MEEGRREGGRCYITPVTTVGRFAKTDTTPGRARTQPCYHRSLSPKKKVIYIEKDPFLQKEKSRKKGKGRQQRKGGEGRRGEERGWKDRWSSEKQQRESPDMTADWGGRWWWEASRFRGLDSEDPRASVGPTTNQQGAHSSTAALSLQFTHL